MTICQRWPLTPAFQSTGQPGSNRNPVTHHPSPPQSQSRSNTFWYAIIVGVIVVQALISYVWSVIRRGRGERDKKFI